MAAEKGVTESELLDEIMSSYWVLEDLSDVIVDQDVEPREQRLDEPESEAADRQPAAPEATTPARQPTTPREDVAEAEPKQPEDELEISGIEQELEKLRTVIDELSNEDEISEDRPAEAGAESTDPDDEFGEYKQAETEEEITPGSGAIDQIDAELGEIRSRIGELETQFQTRRQEFEAEQDQLESWLENEFDNVEKVLEHLLSTTDNIEYRLGSAIEAHREQLEPLQEAYKEQSKLSTLKTEALQKGVETAECDDCGCEVSIGMLPEPYCPDCEREFTGVEDSGWWPFSTDTLRTNPRPRSAVPPQQAPKAGGSQFGDQQSGFDDSNGFDDTEGFNQQDGFDEQTGSADSPAGFDDQPTTQPTEEFDQQAEQSSTHHDQRDQPTGELDDNHDQRDQPAENRDDTQPRTDGGFNWVGKE